MSGTAQLTLDLLQPLRPTLDNFVVGSNREALAALRGAAAGAAPDRIIYLWGEPGCGRTHLLRALADLPGAYVWSKDSTPEQPGLALVDDADQLDADAQVALFNRLNAARARADAACVIAGPAAPAQLALRDDLRTRLAWGLVYQLHALTDAEKADALGTHAASRGVQMSADVIPYLLTHLPRDMRTLVAALDALDAYALARRKPLTLQLVKEGLAQGAAKGPP
ncbi:MAG: DnaA regulatory inactivator Hda [Gemmatimonadota bacterium]